MWRKGIILFNNNLNSAEKLKESYLLLLRFNALNKSTVTEAYTVSDCEFLVSIQVQLKLFGQGKLICMENCLKWMDTSFFSDS